MKKLTDQMKDSKKLFETAEERDINELQSLTDEQKKNLHIFLKGYEFCKRDLGRRGGHSQYELIKAFKEIK